MKYLNNLFVVSLLAFYLTGCSIPGSSGSGIFGSHERRNASTFVDDQSISLKASLALVRNKGLWRNSHISTMNFNNKVLLVGQTSSPYYKEYAEKIVTNIQEVKKIYNEIKVAPRINFSTRARDTWITTQVKTALIGNRDLGPNRVKVITENSVVYLMGILSPEEERIAVNIASHVKGVAKVVDIFDTIERANINPKKTIKRETSGKRT